MESGLVGFFRTTAIIVIAYYVFKFLYAKVLKTSKRSRNSFGKNNGKPNPKKKEDQLGDYVDYEDISD